MYLDDLNYINIEEIMDYCMLKLENPEEAYKLQKNN